MTGMGERDERTGAGRERANAAYVAARANRDVWPRNEKTGAICNAPCPYGGLSSARKYSRVDLGVHARCNRPVKNEGDRCWQHSAPVSAGEPTDEVRDEQ